MDVLLAHRKTRSLRGAFFLNPNSAKNPNQEGVRIDEAAGLVAWELL